MAPSSKHWAHEYTYPEDAQEHYEAVLDATQQFRVQPFHSYIDYAGPWIENHWIFSFMGRELQDFGPYVPLFIQWTDIILWGKPTFTEIQQQLVTVLRPDVMYVTVVQGAEGLKSLSALFPNVLVLSAGGFGHVPIPLIKGEVAASSQREKDAVVTFVGKMLQNRRNVVRGVEKALGDDFQWYRGKNWAKAIETSHFTLCPRGFGRTSFNLVESIQIGVVPIYVWDDVEWLPYRGSEAADWDNFAVSVNANEVHTIPDRLTQLRSTIEEKREKLRKLRDSHFTYSGLLHQIELFLVGGEALSDLRCIAHPPTPGVLSYGEGLEGIFGVLETSGDDLVSFTEFFAGFRQFKVQSVSEPGVQITASFTQTQGRELWAIMDTDSDEFIDYEEWMVNYPFANERMKEFILMAQPQQ